MFSSLRLLAVFAACLVFVTPNTPWAADATVAAAAVSDAEIAKLMDVTNLQSSIGTVPLQIKDAVLRAKPDLGDEDRLQLAQGFNDGKITDALTQGVQADIRTQVDAATYRDIVTWFSSESGQKIMRAERALTTPEGQKKMQEAVAHGASTAMDFDRSQLLHDLDRVTRYSATQRLILDDFIATLATMTKNQDALNKAKQGVQEVQRDLEDRTVWAMNYCFRDLSDDDMRAYIAFYQSPAGVKWVGVLRNFTRALWKSINDTTMSFLQKSEAQQKPAKP